MVTREGVPLVRTGSYILSTGPATFTEEDIRAAVAAYANDPAVHAPRVKIDGLGANFDPDAHGGEPALGTVTNLRASDDGQWLLGDLVIPKWLDDVADWAYPSRSVEGGQGVTTATGQKHDLVITAVALLGVDAPGISTLTDLADFIANGPQKGERVGEPAEVLAADGSTATSTIRAGMDQDIVRRRFVETLDEGDAALPDGVPTWAVWPVAIRFDAAGKPYLKVEDESTGRLYRVDFSISGNEVSFSDSWLEVMEEDTPVAAGSAERPRTVIAWQDRAESRPNPDTEEHDVDIASIRQAAGLTAEQLPDDATAEQVAEALRTTPAPAPAPEGDAAPEAAAEEPEPVAAQAPNIPEGMVLVEADTINELRAGAQRGTEARDLLDRQERDQIIAQAMQDGRIRPAARGDWEQRWERDREETRTLLTAEADKGGLPKGLVPLEARGATRSESDETNDDGQGTGWFPQLEQKGA
jgi:hypothetical protein